MLDCTNKIICGRDVQILSAKVMGATKFCMVVRHTWGSSVSSLFEIIFLES
jgi:hypothetical protein